jgi:hypothetical protein
VQDVAFTLANWESKIREYAKVHHKYTEMRAWPGKMETSDITYDDKKGIFTRFLREKGYLQSEIWNNATPKYYLEVKTTTKGCDTRFFVSKAQYKLVSPLDSYFLLHQTRIRMRLTKRVRCETVTTRIQKGRST